MRFKWPLRLYTLDLDEFPLTGIAADGSTMTVDVATSITDADNGISIGDLILFSNPLGHAIQQVTSLVGARTVAFGATDSMNLNQRTAPAGPSSSCKTYPAAFQPRRRGVSGWSRTTWATPRRMRPS